MENAFGILAQRWQLLLTTVMQGPDVLRAVVECCVCLHNLIRLQYPTLPQGLVDTEDDAHNVEPGSWRLTANMTKVDQVRGPNIDPTAGKRQREYSRKAKASAEGYN